MNKYNKIIQSFANFSIRAIGSAAMNLCMVAEGSCDAYFEYGIHIWDYGTINSDCFLLMFFFSFSSCWWSNRSRSWSIHLWSIRWSIEFTSSLHFMYSYKKTCRTNISITNSCFISRRLTFLLLLFLLNKKFEFTISVF